MPTGYSVVKAKIENKTGKKCLLYVTPSPPALSEQSPPMKNYAHRKPSVGLFFVEQLLL